MKGLHYSLPVVRLRRVCHERLLKCLIVELLHIFGYLGKTAEKLPFSRGRRKPPADVLEGDRFLLMALEGRGAVFK